MSTWVEGPDLVVGSVFALRTFKFNKQLRIESPSFSYLWFPGVNEAQCACTTYSGGAPERLPGESWLDYSDRVAATKPEWHKPETASCGFHGYLSERVFDNMDRTAYGDRPIWGVIEVSGSVVIGEKGLRAQQARIVALALEALDGAWEVSAKARERLASGYPDVVLFDTKAEMLKEFAITRSADFAVKDEEEVEA